MNKEEILIKLNKVKIAKLEFALVDDFTKEFNSALDKDTSISTTLISALSKAETGYKKVKGDYENAVKIGEKAIASAKELGVDLPATFTNKIASSKAGIKEAQNYISKIKQLYSIF